MRRFYRSANPNVRILLLTFVFAILLFVFILLINRAEPIVQGRSFTLGDPGAVLANLELEENTIQLMALIPTLEVMPPSGAGYEGNLVRIRLDDFGYYVYDADNEADADSFCLDSLRVAYNYLEPQSAEVGEILVGLDLLDGSEPLCADLGEPLLGTEATLWVRSTVKTPANRDFFEDLYLEMPTNNLFYRYPYDSFAMTGTLQASYRILRGDEIIREAITAPFPVWVFNTDSERNWNIEVTTREDNVDAETPYATDFFRLLREGEFLETSFSFDRPLLFRLTYPLLLIAMIIIIGLLPFVLDLDALLEVSAAILFGIFGLRQVMTPPNSQGQTILDILFLALYVILAFTLVLTVGTRALQSRQSAQTKAVEDQATPSAWG